ncbi:MAG: PepSY-like domain-containing protein [Phycisphaeraceae bacterium]|nr:PepSY-like domain-containing protein [Phycisphaerales bacterium]MCB9860414.1 PepSY-like domain-containing protein [Phycisphaeraceae bacterium]
MKTITTIGITCALLAAAGAAVGFTAYQRHADSDEIVTLAQCPAAVQDTINAHLNGGTIQEIERTTDHGEVLYEVDVTSNEGVIEFDVAEDGTFQGYEQDDDDNGIDDDEEEDDDETDVNVTLDEVPAAVKATILANLNGGTITELERSTEDKETVYEVEVDGTRDFVVAEDGTYLGEEDDDEDDDD